MKNSFDRLIFTYSGGGGGGIVNLEIEEEMT